MVYIKIAIVLMVFECMISSILLVLFRCLIVVGKLAESLVTSLSHSMVCKISGGFFFAIIIYSI